jgi:hypothetical protein
MRAMRYILVLLSVLALLRSFEGAGLPIPNWGAGFFLVVFLLLLVWPRGAGGLVGGLAALTFLYLLYRSEGAGTLRQLGVLALVLIGLGLMLRPLRDIRLGVDQTIGWGALGLLAVLVYFLVGLVALAPR